MAVAVDQLHHDFKSFARPPRCRLQSYSHLDHNMPDSSQPLDLAHSLNQAFQVTNLHRSISSPCLPLTPKSFYFNPTVEIVSGHSDPKTRALVAEVAIAMASGMGPVPVSNGLSGAYFLRGRSSETMAVVKPVDGEPFGFSRRLAGTRRSIMAGETGVRELAAYLLDHGGFSGVPPTALVKISDIAFCKNNNSEAIASLQKYIDHESDAGDLGPSGFSVGSVHRIGILDVRLLNLDRHAGNMLVEKGQGERGAVGASELVPIDHGLCLPEWLDDPYFEWLHWPQALVPFSDSEIEYVSNLDPFKEAVVLRREIPSMRESSIRVLVLCTLFLKQAVAAELCLADIGEMMTRKFDGGEENTSVLESICLITKINMSTIQKDVDINDVRHYDDCEILQFDDENEDVGNFIASEPKNVTFSSTWSLSGLVEEEFIGLGNGNIYEDNIAKNNKTNEFKTAGLSRSMTFSEPNHIGENGSVFLGGMSEAQWGMFLEHFEKLLPEVFEERKNMGLIKQRLGTSCEF